MWKHSNASFYDTRSIIINNKVFIYLIDNHFSNFYLHLSTYIFTIIIPVIYGNYNLKHNRYISR